MGGESAPKAEEQAQAANEQSKWASMYNAGAQNPNIVSDIGTVTNEQTGWTTVTDPQTGKVSYVPKYTQTSKMSPKERGVYNANVQGRQGAATTAANLMKNASGMLSKPMEEQGNAWQYYGDPGYRSDIPELVDRRAVEDNIMASTMRTAIPEHARQMANNAAMGNFQGGKNQWREDQMYNDQIAEATRQANLQSFGMSNEAMKLRNEGRQTDWTNQNLIADQSNNVKVAANDLARSLRTGTINEIASLGGYGQPETQQAPGFQSSAVQPFDIAGAKQREYEQNQANQQQMWQSIFGLGGQALKFGFGVA